MIKKSFDSNSTTNLKKPSTIINNTLLHQKWSNITDELYTITNNRTQVKDYPAYISDSTTSYNNIISDISYSPDSDYNPNNKNNLDKKPLIDISDTCDMQKSTIQR